MLGAGPVQDTTAESSTCSAAVRLATLRAAGRDDVDGVGCLLLDGDGALRLAFASGSSGALITTAEALSMEVRGHDASATGVKVVAPAIDGSGWPSIPALLDDASPRSVCAIPILLQ